MISDPESYARLNAQLRRERLQAMTLEQAAAELEALFEFAVGFESASAELKVPPGDPTPLPRVSYAMLLAGAPHEDDVTPEASA
ncbi:MAG: hypothetical protein L0Z55_00755 [Planctomycetes bacterium]|nr:hypothetical protein [Planctomycetota bacterium]